MKITCTTSTSYEFNDASGTKREKSEVDIEALSFSKVMQQ